MKSTAAALLCFISAWAFADQAAPVPLPNAHSHNDYEHERPLLDALDHGFCSVEADIYLVEGMLLVAHNLKDVKPERTLQALYLDPLKERVKQSGGRVYPNGPSVTLLIDFKTEAGPTYAALRDTLVQYADMLTKFTPNSTVEGAVTVILSGNSPLEQAKNEAVRYAAIDGRPGDLDGELNPNLVPLISENWRSLFKWWGDGKMPEEQHARLVSLVTKAHEKGCRVRFWGTPEREDLWSLLRETGVDLLNTDQLPRLQKFFLQDRKQKQHFAQREHGRLSHHATTSNRFRRIGRHLPPTAPAWFTAATRHRDPSRGQSHARIRRTRRE